VARTTGLEAGGKRRCGEWDEPSRRSIRNSGACGATSIGGVATADQRAIGEAQGAMMKIRSA